MNQFLITILEQTINEKLRIQTLTDVFLTFKAQVDKYKDYKIQFSDNYKKQKFYFDYDNKNWTGTITNEFPVYSGKQTHFINIKLPMDGFVMSKKYEKPDYTDSLLTTGDSTRFVNIVASILPFESYTYDIYYNVDAKQVALYFWNTSVANQCVTVKFEYRTYNFIINRQRYTSEHLKTLVASLQ